jgi:hypothetical protein
LLWHVPILDSDQYSKWIIGFSAVAIIIGYTQLNEFGIISPPYHIQNTLKGHHSTEHFELYYDGTHYSDTEIALLGAEHEFYLEQISQELNLILPDTAEKIESYLYGHPWQKKQLVGAKFTSYVPVWLKQDQLHIAKQQIENSLRHELVHVLAKQFGNELLNASWSIGLIEGLAVAIDGGSSLKSTIDQIVVSEKPYPNAEELQKAFSPWGFYGGRSGVNYITAGSFVEFLIQRYPIESLKEAYKTGNIADSYEDNWEKLTANWHQHLDTVQVDSVDREIAGRIFGVPSLFEKECPHVVSDFAVAWDAYQFNLAEQDTASALTSLDRALAAQRLAQRGHHPSQELVAGGHLQDATGAADVVALLDLEPVAQDHGPDVVLLQVQGQGGHRLAGLGGVDLQHLAGHRLREAVDAGDSVLHLQDLTHLFGAQLSPGTVYPSLHSLEESDVLSMHAKVRTKEYSIADTDLVRSTIERTMLQHLAFGLLLYAFLPRL